MGDIKFSASSLFWKPIFDKFEQYIDNEITLENVRKEMRDRGLTGDLEKHLDDMMVYLMTPDDDYVAQQEKAVKEGRLRLDEDLKGVNAKLFQACEKMKWNEASALLTESNSRSYVEYCSVDGQNALHLLARYNGPPELIKKVVELGGNINQQNLKKDTPLNVALIFGASAVTLNALFANGANVREGRSCLHVATQNESTLESLSLLLNECVSQCNGPDMLNEYSDKGITPFHAAVITQYSPGVLRLFLRHGGDPKLEILGGESYKGCDIRQLLTKTLHIDGCSVLDNPRIEGKFQCNACLICADSMPRCAKCKSVHYCSAECQKKDFSVHKMSCIPMMKCAYCKEFNKLSKCGGCNEISYCSLTCQKADWSRHKHECKMQHKQ